MNLRQVLCCTCYSGYAFVIQEPGKCLSMEVVDRVSLRSAHLVCKTYMEEHSERCFGLISGTYVRAREVTLFRCEWNSRSD